jgi:hypothetical protein
MKMEVVREVCVCVRERGECVCERDGKEVCVCGKERERV